MEDIRTLAVAYHQAGNNCAETVVKVCNDSLAAHGIHPRRRCRRLWLSLRGLERSLSRLRQSRRPDAARGKDKG